MAIAEVVRVAYGEFVKITYSKDNVQVCYLDIAKISHWPPDNVQYPSMEVVRGVRMSEVTTGQEPQ